MQIRITYLSIAVLAVFAMAGPSTAATTAGTIINARSNCAYSNSKGQSMSTATSNTVSVTVARASTVSVSADTTTCTVASGDTALFNVSVTNTGNAVDTFAISASVQTANWQTGVFVDANSNGKVDAGELRSSIQTSAMNPGSSQNLVVAAVPTGISAEGTTAQVSLIAKSVSDSTVSQTLILSVAVNGAHRIREWAMLGYFTNSDSSRIAQDYLNGEGNAVPGVNVDTNEWEPLESDGDNIDLSEFYDNPTNCVAYAGVYIHSDAAADVTLKYTSSGPSRVWLNGKAVYSETALPSDPNADRSVPVFLQAGWNRLILKLAQSSGQWQFSAVLVDASGQYLQDLGITTERQTEQGAELTDVQTSDISTDSAALQWESDIPTSTIVNYGVGAYTQKYEDTALTTQHMVKLSGLNAGTRYSFVVGGFDVFGYSVTGEAQSFNTSASSTSQWITAWLVDGPYFTNYPNYLLTTDFLYYEAYAYPYEGLAARTGKWTAASTGSDGVLDFNSYYPGKQVCVAYAHVYVYSPIYQQVLLLTGSNDGIRGMLNSRIVLYKGGWRALVPDQDKTTVILNRGWNRLLIKVSQLNGPWQMCARFTTLDGKPVQGLQYKTNRP